MTGTVMSRRWHCLSQFAPVDPESPDAALREAVEAIVVNTQLAGTLLESLRRRDLTRLIEASVRRARALDACRQTLGVGECDFGRQRSARFQPIPRGKPLL